MYIIRFTDTPERDLEQNYSIRNYLLGNTREMAAYHGLLTEGGWGDMDENEAIAQFLDERGNEIVEVDGQYALRLNGLCGITAFEALEDAEAYAEKAIEQAKSFAYGSAALHIFQGHVIGYDENDEGVIFKAESIVK